MTEGILKTTEILCPNNSNFFKTISLFSNAIADCIRDLGGGDILCQLKEKFKFL
jgi:hypothetical protein